MESGDSTLGQSPDIHTYILSLAYRGSTDPNELLGNARYADPMNGRSILVKSFTAM